MSKHQIIFKNGVANKNLDAIVKLYPVCTCTIEEGEPKKRSLSANALQHAWIKEISEYTGHSIIDIARYLKLEIGLPILMYDAETQDEIDTARKIQWTVKKIGLDELPYDKRVKIMDMLQVTSIMSSRQHTEYRDQVKAHYAPGLELIVR